MRMFLVLAFTMMCARMLPAQQPVPPYGAEASYDPRVSPPDSVLGFAPGTRAATYEEINRYFRVLAGQSRRVQIAETGRTQEGRSLLLAIISSEDRMSHLEQVRADMGRLADPRTLSSSETERLVASTPAVVWIGYGIHGDELSSCDAAMQVAYQLAAGTDTGTAKMLQELVILIDPMQNPDGRDRFLCQMQQWGGPIPNSDAQSMQHTGMWPQGRGNHYLFDLNRDWFALVHPETRARVHVMLRWNPQVAIDSHEMGGYDTYLFSPPREPINTNVAESVRRWWKVFAADQARAFDRQGWSYYTREWNDEWYPGYGASWCNYAGGIGILYEQAGVEGSLVRRPDGTTLTFREAVLHHVVSSLANLGTAASHRKELLLDFLAVKKTVYGGGKNEPLTFYIVPGKNPARAADVVEVLTAQGIEVKVAERECSVPDARSQWSDEPRLRKLPPGTYVVSLNQPLGRLAKAILEFDPRMSTEVLTEERKSLERTGQTRMYDATGWSLAIAYGVETYWSTRKPDVATHPSAPLAGPSFARGSAAGLYGYLMDYADDRTVKAVGYLLAGGYKVRVGKESFSIGGTAYGRGTILIRVNENTSDLHEAIRNVCEKTGAGVAPVTTALASTGVDLGGNDFMLLQQPRIAVLAGPEVSSTGFGAIWQLLDARMGLRFTMLNTQYAPFADLRKYNVLVLPPGSTGAYRRLFDREGVARLRQWIDEGGTLVGTDDAAAFLADTATGLSSVRLRRQALKDLDLYAQAVTRERRGRAPQIDSAAIWEGRGEPDTVFLVRQKGTDEKVLALTDERGRQFAPRGVILRVDLDPEHWLSFGAGDRVGALIETSNAFLSKPPVATPGRFAVADSLRVSGLLWPEARHLWAETAYLTREPRGQGQIILFAGEPGFRGFFRGTERLFVNALLLGPGCGAQASVEF